MNREDIIRMAREAGCPVAGIGPMTFDDKQLVLMLERFANLVAQAESEACAKIVLNEAYQYTAPVWAVEIVNDIRARGQA
jgi:hypothetical protein